MEMFLFILKMQVSASSHFQVLKVTLRFENTQVKMEKYTPSSIPVIVEYYVTGVVFQSRPLAIQSVRTKKLCPERRASIRSNGAKVPEGSCGFGAGETDRVCYRGGHSMMPVSPIQCSGKCWSKH